MTSTELKSELDRMDVDSSAHSRSPERIAHRLTDSLTLPYEHHEIHSYASSVSPTHAEGESLADEDANVVLPDRLSLLHVSNGRIYGKSSGAALVQTVLDLKAEPHNAEDEPEKNWGSNKGSEGSRRSPETGSQASEKKPYVWVTHAVGNCLRASFITMYLRTENWLDAFHAMLFAAPTALSVGLTF